MATQTWNSIQNALVVMLSQAPPPYNVIPADFTALLPQATSYAEQRIYRELVPLNQRNTDTTLSTVAGSRLINLANAARAVDSIERFALLVAGELYYFDAATLDAIDLAWPNQTLTWAPDQADYLGRYWAMLSDSVIAISPTPDQSYQVNLTGNFVPVPISYNNQTTYLSVMYPELLIAACMIFLTGGLLRNFGAQGDDPKMGLSWEGDYTKLMQSAVFEEERRRMAGVGWSQYSPNPVAKPDRSRRND